MQPTITTSDWNLLRVFNYYRLTLILCLFLLWTFHISSIGNASPTLLLCTLSTYTCTGILFFICSTIKKPLFNTQVILQVFLDILALTLIVHASGGIHTGFGMLFIPIIASASLLAPGKISFLFAAMATIAMLSQQIHTQMSTGFEIGTFTAVGLSGLTLFLTTIIINVLAKQLQHSKALTQKQRKTLAKLEQLSSLIIQKIHTGVVIVNDKNQPLTMNVAARFLLYHEASEEADSTLPAPLCVAIDNWRNKETKKSSQVFECYPTGPQIYPSFFPLEKVKESETLVFLDDLTLKSEMIQNAKLASIGRLSASIAHEIRNPLSSINHSAQLLLESTEFNANSENKKLLDIIIENGKRTNKVIENVLSISKAQKISQPESIELSPWLQQFITQFKLPFYKNLNLQLEAPEKENIKVLFDPSQLRQVLNNICSNAVYHSHEQSKDPFALLRITKTTQEIGLDIIDKGKGISKRNQAFLFEPFFSTEAKGTGLGLYIARELCQANGATLQYYALETGGSQFRIIFQQ